jgi:BirA family biotin operon repressor/biotin-[acetyl-CoA-carboxylase] ligase
MSTTSWLGKQRIDLDECGSTSDEAARLARAGAGHGTIVIADRQTSGRGRLGRSWLSPRGNLYLSAVLRLPLQSRDVPPLTLAAGIAVCDAIRTAGVADAMLKWPNDVVCGTHPHKLAGILVEAQSQSGRIDAIVLGIGVNLRGPIADEIADRAIAIADVVGELRAPDRDRFVADLLPRLESWIDRYVAGGATVVVPAWQERMCRDLRVRVVNDTGIVEGIGLGLEPDGALQVRDDGDVIHRIRSGEAAVVPR